ncbi:MAG: NAD(P)-binding domain-containing protein, partial [Dehalococcoidia bacterium]|nr:NAD(P)-binding domain-containing protein [Dehalococcoidia bacterium]
MEARGSKAKKKIKIAFIGGGAMGEAMAKCLLNKKMAGPQDVVVSDVSPVRREVLNREYGVSCLADNREAVKNADLIILAVKPQNLPQVMDEIKGLAAEQLVLSIVA